MRSLLIYNHTKYICTLHFIDLDHLSLKYFYKFDISLRFGLF